MIVSKNFIYELTNKFDYSQCQLKTKFTVIKIVSFWKGSTWTSWTWKVNVTKTGEREASAAQAIIALSIIKAISISLAVIKCVIVRRSRLKWKRILWWRGWRRVVRASAAISKTIEVKWVKS